jgi:signal transduction histidine kinase
VISAVVRPLWLALYQGEAGPPHPRARWLAPRTPRWLALLPSPRLDLVQAAGLLLTVIAFFTTSSQVAEWTAVSGNGHYLMAAAVALPIALRDRWPLWAWRAAFLALPYSVWVTSSIGVQPGDPPYTFLMAVSYLLATYSVAVRSERRITVAVWAVSVLAAWIIHPDSMAVATVLVTVTVLFGHNVRVRRSATAQLVVEERRTQEAIGAQSVLEERARIARELHDVVAHHMSVIAIQAEAVPLKAAGDSAQLEAGLADIRALSLEAIAQLRQVLGVLRDQDGRTDTTPQPGLDRVEELIANARAAGLVVLAKLPGSLEGLPTAVGLSAYRIVQESLSNAMRHAPGATVVVDVGRDDGGLRLHITNGPGVAPAGAPGAGQGLVGMRERAALLGGTLDAGPVPVGGFQVTATLPVDGTTERRSG